MGVGASKSFEYNSLSYFYSDFKFEIVSVDVIWWNFMHFYADFKFEIVSIDAMYRMCMQF